MNAEEIVSAMLSRIDELNHWLDSQCYDGPEEHRLWKTEVNVLTEWVKRIRRSEQTRPVGNGLAMRVNVMKQRTGEI